MKEMKKIKQNKERLPFLANLNAPPLSFTDHHGESGTFLEREVRDVRFSNTDIKLLYSTAGSLCNITRKL